MGAKVQIKNEIVIVMATIKEYMNESFWETEINDHPAKAFEQGFELGANKILSLVEAEIERSILNDYKDFTDNDRELVQGALAWLHLWLQTLKDKK